MKTVAASLQDTLQAVADYLSLNVSELIAYANEDTHTGWDFGAGDWKCGSLHRPEGQTLYAIVRALRPKSVLEMGALEGCSTTHIAQALAANKAGHLTSIDIAPGFGSKVPVELRSYVTQRVQWAGEAIEAAKNYSLDMIYEDTDHSAATTEELWIQAFKKVKKGGVIVSHDPCSASVGQAVISGIRNALEHDDFLIVQVPPSDCGLAIWRKV